MTSSETSKADIYLLSPKCLLEPELSDDVLTLVCLEAATDERLLSKLLIEMSSVSVEPVPLEPDDDVDRPSSSSDSSSLPTDVILLPEETDPFLLADLCTLLSENRLDPNEMSPPFVELKSIALS